MAVVSTVPPRLEPPDTVPDPWRRPTWLPAWLGALGLLTLLVVAWVAPAGQVFFPRCSFHALTGWQCPGCGITRATHALLNGRWGEAWRLNPLWLLTLPLLAWTYGVWLVNDVTHRRWPQPLTNRFGVAVFLGVSIGFGVARNFPWASWLGR